MANRFPTDERRAHRVSIDVLQTGVVQVARGTFNHGPLAAPRWSMARLSFHGANSKADLLEPLLFAVLEPGTTFAFFQVVHYCRLAGRYHPEAQVAQFFLDVLRRAAGEARIQLRVERIAILPGQVNTPEFPEKLLHGFGRREHLRWGADTNQVELVQRPDSQVLRVGAEGLSACLLEPRFKRLGYLLGVAILRIEDHTHFHNLNTALGSGQTDDLNPEHDRSVGAGEAGPPEPKTKVAVRYRTAKGKDPSRQIK